MAFPGSLDTAIIKAEETRVALETVVQDSVTGADEINILDFSQHVSDTDATKRDVKLTFVLLASDVPASIADKLNELTNLTRGTR